MCLYLDGVVEKWSKLFLTARRNAICNHTVDPSFSASTLQWSHNERDGVSNHQPHDCLLSRLFRRRSKKTSKLRVTGLCAGNSPVTGEFPAQRTSNAENVSIWWRHHEISLCQHWSCIMRHQYTTDREGHPAGYLWLYQTGPLPFSQFPATSSEIEDA